MFMQIFMVEIRSKIDRFLIKVIHPSLFFVVPRSHNFVTFAIINPVHIIGFYIIISTIEILFLL